MKIKHLLFSALMLGTSLVKSQCNVTVSNVVQTPILCNGGSADLSMEVSGGTAPYSYSVTGATVTGTITPDSVIWAQSVLGFSNEYGSGWTAAAALGAPDIYPTYGDIPGSWTTSSSTVRDYLIVSFPSTVSSKVFVVENNEPGSCDTVYVRATATGIWHTIYTGTAFVGPSVATIQTYTIPASIGAVNAVRLAVDGSMATYYEVDAIGLLSPTLLYPLNFSGIPAGSYTLSITDNAACTYTAPYTFTEPAPITYTQNLTICSNQQVYVGGSMYNSTGNYSDLLSSVNGCDSTVYTNLTVNSGNATYHYIDTVMCAGSTFTVGTYAHTTSGLYLDTLVNAVGCDSIVEVTLKIYTSNNPIVSIKEVPTINTATGGTASASDFYSGNPEVDAFDGDFDILGWGSNGNGLPSWLEYDYGTGNSKVVKAYSFYCSSNMTGGWGSTDYDPKEWNFQAYNGTAWVNLDTVVDPNPTQDIWNTHLVNNNTAYQKYRMYVTYTDDQDYVMITELKLLALDSCSNKLFIAKANDLANDTVTNIQWTINGTPVGTNSDSLVVNSFNLGDVINCTITTNNSCATTPTATTNFTVNTGAAVATASINVLTLTAYPAGATSYQWYDCTNQVIINGANSQTYSVTANGSYAVIIKSGSCSTDTSNCIVVSTVGLKDNVANAAVRLYPNPNNGTFTLDVNNETADVQIIDLLGNTIYTAKHTKGSVTLNLSDVASGVYLIKVNSNNTHTTNRLIINK